MLGRCIARTSLRHTARRGPVGPGILYLFLVCCAAGVALVCLTAIHAAKVQGLLERQSPCTAPCCRVVRRSACSLSPLAASQRGIADSCVRLGKSHCTVRSEGKREVLHAQAQDMTSGADPPPPSFPWGVASASYQVSCPCWSWPNGPLGLPLPCPGASALQRAGRLVSINNVPVARQQPCHSSAWWDACCGNVGPTDHLLRHAPCPSTPNTPKVGQRTGRQPAGAGPKPLRQSPHPAAGAAD